MSNRRPRDSPARDRGDSREETGLTVGTWEEERPRFDALLDEAESLRGEGKDEGALRYIQECISIADRFELAPSLTRYLFSQEAGLLERLGDLPGSVSALQRLAVVAEGRVDLACSALFRGSELMARVGDFGRARALVLEVVSRYQDNTAAEARAARIGALARAAEFSRRLGEPDRTIGFAEELERTFDPSLDGVKASRVTASFDRAMALRALQRHDEALDGYKHVLELVQDQDVPRSRWYAAASLRFQVGELAHLGREDELAVLVEPLRSYARDAGEVGRQALAGLDEMVVALVMSERWQEALAVIEIAIEMRSVSSDEWSLGMQGLTLRARALVLERLDRADEAALIRKAALEFYAPAMLAELDSRLGDSTHVPAASEIRQGSSALLTKALILIELGEDTMALEPLRELLARYAGSDDLAASAAVDEAREIWSSLTDEQEPSEQIDR